MKQFVFCDHNLNMKHFVLTDKTVKVYDCISPQKTTIEIPLNYDIANNDIVIIRDQNTAEVEYLGMIDTVQNDKTTRVLLYPFETILDNECLLDELDGDVFTWIKDMIERNYTGTNDPLNDFPIIVENHITNAVTYKRIIESKNFLDNLSDIFLNTGVYVRFGISYSATGQPENIIASVYNANEGGVINIRYDNPVIVDSKVVIENSHTRNANKAIIRLINSQDEVVDTVALYLKDNNQLTTNPQDPARIKQVIPRIIDYKPSDDEVTAAQQGEAVILLAEKALCGNGFDHSIEFVVVLNSGYEWGLNKRCDFLAQDRIYYTYVTRVEYLSDKHAKIRLGAYRYALTDRFKFLRKREVEANSVRGIPVTAKFERSMFWFTQDENGHLILHYPDTISQPRFTVEGGHLVFRYDGEAGEYTDKYEIDSAGKLVYNL